MSFLVWKSRWWIHY